jgi:hypothetical protein
MKAYIMVTKNMKLDKGARTPVLSKSNFDVLLTPGNRPQKPMIHGLCPVTPLIDCIEQSRKNPKVIFAQTPIIASALPNQTPRTR